jgi:hypothetical protein
VIWAMEAAEQSNTAESWRRARIAGIGAPVMDYRNGRY